MLSSPKMLSQTSKSMTSFGKTQKIDSRLIDYYLPVKTLKAMQPVPIANYQNYISLNDQNLFVNPD